jgi:site-specific DNA-methyltransferase (adenine-specific)
MTKKYQIIYADPPWRYDFAGTSNRKIENKYQTMSIEELCGLKIPADDNSVLYLWATAPKLPEALRLIEAWGFKYKSQAVWDKGSPAMGYWFRGQHEILIAATRGKMSPPPADKRCGSMLRYPNQSRLARIDGKCNAHSRKPWEIRAMIARWYPGMNMVELFAREKTEGWDSWGNEVECDLAL